MESLKDLKKAVKTLEKANAKADKLFENLMDNEQITPKQRSYARQMFNCAKRGGISLKCLNVDSIVKQFNSLG